MTIAAATKKINAPIFSCFVALYLMSKVFSSFMMRLGMDIELVPNGRIELPSTDYETVRLPLS